MLWNLIHDGTNVVNFFQAPASTEVGFNGAIYLLEQFTTKSEAVTRIAALGLVHDTDANGDPTPPKDIA